MKKIIFLLIAIVTIHSNLHAQNDKEIKNSIRINGLALFAGFYEFQYERLITEKGAIKIGFGTGTLLNRKGSDADKDFKDAFNSSSFSPDQEHSIDGFSLNADFRYFFSHLKAPKGLYVSPGIQYLKLQEKYTYTNNNNELTTLANNNYTIFNLRFLAGYQFIIAKTVIFNPYLGGGIALGTTNENSTQAAGSGTGSTVTIGIDIGIGF